MHIVGYKTPPITSPDNLVEIIVRAIPVVEENSIIIVSSKIVAISEGAVTPILSSDRETLIREQSDYWLDPRESQYGHHFTIKNNTLIGSAGIDSSNGNGDFVLWPRNPQVSANQLREALSDVYGIPLGVIISDSASMPLRRGSSGVAIAHSGFSALASYIGQQDVFGRTIEHSVTNRAEGLAAAATLVMGEGNEQTPLAVASEVPSLVCITRNPSSKELNETYLDPRDDLFEPFWKGVGWVK